MEHLYYPSVEEFVILQVTVIYPEGHKPARDWLDYSIHAGMTSYFEAC